MLAQSNDLKIAADKKYARVHKGNLTMIRQLSTIIDEPDLVKRYEDDPDEALKYAERKIAKMKKKGVKISHF